MQTMAKIAVTGFLAAALSGQAWAGDMGGVVTYSLGEFDRVGVSQSQPQVQPGSARRKSASSAVPASHNRELNAQKAEFVRRMFWMALSMR